MSKLETVRALNASAPQLGIVESVRELQQTNRQMQEALQQLPDAVAAAVVTGTGAALRPLGTLPQDVRKALEAFDTITAQQRRSLDALAEQMTNSAAAAFELKAKKLDATLTELRSLSQAAAQMNNAPKELEKETERMRQMVSTLILSSDRPRWWKTALMMIFTIAIGGALAATGQAALTRYLPLTDTQAKARAWDITLSRATQKERKLIEEISQRRE